MWAARANSRAELREGRRLARSESARRMQQVRMFCGKAIVRTAHWTERETGPELDESVVKPNNLILSYLISRVRHRRYARLEAGKVQLHG
jgi:hypothetical protein